MRIAVLVGLLIATAACGSYRFPGPGTASGNVHGQVIALGCGGLAQPVDQPCPATSIACLPQPADSTCGRRPMAGLALLFTKDHTSLVANTDSAGEYSIDLPAGTWAVSTANFARLISGPQSLEVTAGTSIVADYIVDTGMRPAA